MLLRYLFAGTDPIGFCAMCSQTNAGVRLNLTDEDFDYMRLKYTCRHPNNSEIVIEEVYNIIHYHP